MLRKYPIIKDLYKLSKDDIDSEAMNILKKYHPECIESAIPVPIEEIIEKEGINIVPQYLSLDQSILGACVFSKGFVKVFENGVERDNEYDSKTIIIDCDIYINESANLKYTEAHEFGHYVLQFDIKHINEKQISLFDIEIEPAIICKRDSILNPHSKDIGEWQADYFAASILIPKPALKKEIKEYLVGYDEMNQEKPLDKLNNNELKILVDRLKDKFQVSKASMKYRLVNLDMLSKERYGDI